MNAAIIVTGLLAGMLSGLFGVGGGLLTMPVLRMVFDISPDIVIGTSLATIIPTTLLAAYRFRRNELLDMRAAAISAPPAMLAGIMGATVTEFVDAHLLMLATSLIMLAVGASFISGRTPEIRTKKSATRLSISGAVAGLLSGMLGIGGGIVLVSAYTIFVGMGIKEAIGTSLLVIAATVIPGTIVHYSLGNIDPTLVFLLTCGVLPGSALGAKLAINTNGRRHTSAFGIFLLVTGVIFFYREIRFFI